MIAGPHQNDRTLIEVYAQRMSDDPARAGELFTETAELHPTTGGPRLQGRAQINDHLSKAPKATYKVLQHLARHGDDNSAELRIESKGAEPRIETVRFRTDGKSFTKLELMSSRKA